MERKERTCKEYQSEEVEDVCHWLLQCPAWDHLRRPLVEEVSQCDGFQGQSVSATSDLLYILLAPYDVVHFNIDWLVDIQRG